jgi:predicted RNase H-related nuclease YkuK (DUF458 family)
MFEKKWKTVDGAVLAEPLTVIREALSGQRTVYVGTDSQQDGKVTQFVTVVAVHEPGKGGRAFYTVETADRIKSLRERLLREVFHSVQLALELEPMLNKESSLEVHVDANPNVKFKSSLYVKELTAMVVSQGLYCVLKPESWAATHLGDHVVKAKVIGR